jgi:hypothetical protein
MSAAKSQVESVGREKSFFPGEAGFAPPHEHYMISRNASPTASAKLLVIFIIPHGEKLTEFLPAK